VNFIAIDFETANEARTSACSVGLAFVEDGKLVGTKHYLIKPEPYVFKRFNVSLHGITANDVADAPTFNELAPELLSLLDGKLVVAHNAEFDIGVLNAALSHYGMSFPGIEYICTMQLSQAAVAGLENYRLDTLCGHFGIELDHHHAESDATACARLLLAICSSLGCCNIDELMEKLEDTGNRVDEFAEAGASAGKKRPRKSAHKDKYFPKNHKVFTEPAELHKAVNTLKGIVAGITTDLTVNRDEAMELLHWCTLHSHLRDKHPFSELLPAVERIYEDGVVTDDEARDIVWLCSNFISDSSYYDLITSSIQFLAGMFHGIMADGVLTDSEIESLSRWIGANDYLRGCYPFDELESLLITVKQDGKIDESERNMLMTFFSNFIDVKASYNLKEPELLTSHDQYSISGICAIDPQIIFNGCSFVITGETKRATRKEISELIENAGGRCVNKVSSKTNYVVVGALGSDCWAFSCYGRKIEDAMKQRAQGNKLIIVNEFDLWDALYNTAV
jgi:DNA polymerase III epsilon subunit family exonuclease